MPSNLVAYIIESSDGFAIGKVASGVKSGIDFAAVAVGMLASNLGHGSERNAISVIIVLQSGGT